MRRRSAGSNSDVQSALEVVDHLVLATPDLEAGIDVVEALTGVRAAAGGSHPGMGTKNALLSLGPRAYLEIIGPDPAQDDYRHPRVFGVDSVDRPRLVTWAAKTTDVDRTAATLLPGDCHLGQPHPGSRRRPDGSLLAWRLTDPYVVVADGIVPFYIDWLDTPHPAADAPGDITLTSLVAGHPEANDLQRHFDALALTIPVVAAPSPILTATLRTAGGTVELH
mgnify:CR=1 FL=1